MRSIMPTCLKGPMWVRKWEDLLYFQPGCRELGLLPVFPNQEIELRLYLQCHHSSKECSFGEMKLQMFTMGLRILSLNLFKRTRVEKREII